jgi:hypothetical protein
MSEYIIHEVVREGDGFIERDRAMTPEEAAAFEAQRTLDATPKLADYENAVQNMLDAKAKERGYDNIHSAAIRAGYPGPFHDEGVSYASWMDACWAQCYSILTQVQSGAMAQPTIADLLAQLPTFQS